MKKLLSLLFVCLCPFLFIKPATVKNILLDLPQIGFYEPSNFQVLATNVAGATNKYRLRPINVTSYGTVGDGVKDDGPTIQAALNYADSIGGAVVAVPAGVYLIVNPRNGDSGKGKFGLRIGSNTSLNLAPAPYYTKVATMML